MAKVCISGYYGYDRIENELMLMSMVGSLRRQNEDMEIVVFSANEAQTEADLDVAALDRNNGEQIRKELRNTDLLIVGGGHLLKETDDLEEIKYYLKIIKTAQRMNVPVFLYHQTLAPFANSRTKAMVGRVLQKVSKITVADQTSVEVLHEMGIRRGRIHLQEDPVLALGEVKSVWSVSEAAPSEKKAPAAKTAAAKTEETKTEADKADKIKKTKTEEPKAQAINYDGMDVEIEIRIVEKEEPAEGDGPILIEELMEALREETNAPEDVALPAEAQKAKPAKPVTNRPENLAAIVPSFWKKPGEKYAAFVVAPKTELPVTQITALANHMVESGYQVVFLPLCYEEDAVLAKEILSMMQHPAYIVDGKMSPPSFCTAVNAVDFVFTTELYPMIIAALNKKPFTALCCSERELSFVGKLGLTPAGNLMDFNKDAFVFNFKAAVADPGAIVTAIEENLPSLQEKAIAAEEQLAMVFERIARNKARAAKNSPPHRSSSVVADEELPGEDATASAKEVPTEETAAELGGEKANKETEVLEKVEEIEEIEASKEAQGQNIEEKAEEGYVRRSRRESNAKKGPDFNENLNAIKDKANDVIGGLKGKFKAITAKADKASRRPTEDDITEEPPVSDEFSEVTEEKEAK